MRELPRTGDVPEYQLRNAVNELVRGSTNALTEVTLDANQATTTLSHILISPTSELFFSPKTANAAAELATMYVSAVTDGQATITHTNNVQIDRTFAVKICTGEE